MHSTRYKEINFNRLHYYQKTCKASSCVNVEIVYKAVSVHHPSNSPIYHLRFRTGKNISTVRGDVKIDGGRHGGGGVDRALGAATLAVGSTAGT